jgi:hypothetical protein
VLLLRLQLGCESQARNFGEIERKMSRNMKEVAMMVIALFIVVSLADF